MSITSKAISLSLTLFVLSVLLPIAFAYLMSMTTTGMDTAVITLLQVLLPIVVVIGIIYKFIPKKGD